MKKILALASFAVLALASSFAQTNTIQLRDGANTATLKAGASGGNVTITLPTSSSTLLSGSGTTNKSARWSASGLTDGTFSDNGTGTFTTSESVLFTTTDASSPSIGFSATGVQPGTTTTCSFSIKNNSMSGYGYVTGATLAVPNNATAGLEFVINGTHKGMLMLETWAGDGTYARNIGNVPAGEYQFIVPNTTSPLVAFYIGKVRSAFEVGDLQVLSGNILVGGSSTASQLRFYEPSGSGTNYTAFKAGIQTSDITYTLPQSDGSSGQVLSTNGSGTLTWATSTSVASINDLTDAKNSGLNFSHSLALGSEPSGTLNNAEFNTAVGVYSMLNITSGDHNVALGYGSLNLLNSGSQNTAVGSTAGQNITTGTQNVCLGFEAGKTLTTGTGNVFIGHQTGSAVAVGTSNTLMISNSNDATPLIYGDFSTDQLTLNGHVEVAIGTTTSTVPFSILGTGIQGAANVENAYLGTDVPTLFVRNTTNSADANAVLLVGVGGSGSASSAGDAYLSLDVATVGGWSMGIDNSDSDKLKFLDSWDFKSDGGTPAYGLPVMTMTRLTRRVGIGTENPAYMLDVAGDIQANTTVYTSDARLKRNVQPIGNALGTVAKLRPVSYEKRADLRSNDYSMKQMGFIAQELESVLPNSVHTDKSADAIKSVDYISIIPVLTKALQEQQELIAKQQELIAKQQELVAKQQQEIDELKKMVKRMSLR